MADDTPTVEQARLAIRDTINAYAPVECRQMLHLHLSEPLGALIAAVRAENHAPLLAKAVIELWKELDVQDAHDWLYQARQVAGQIADEPS